jgi:CheY-like chemotaxis protein/HPt (histidine-containing phosphotransfer) domain-containing protein
LLEDDNDTVNLEFKVEDNGIGIPENKLNAIFENFTQVNSKTTRKYSGTGLGLPITKQLVEQQDGTISVMSKLNVGSVFSFTLRFKKVIINSVENNHHHFNFSVFPKANLSGVQVLIVDDNKINQQVASLTLQKWNAKTIIANGAQDAFGLLEKHHFDLILMDVTMPEIDGFEATKKIRQHSNPRVATIPIVAITAAAFIADKNKCIEAGMNDYISKPFDPTDLLNKIHQLLPRTQDDQTQQPLCDLSLLKDRAAGDTDFMKEILESYIQEMPLYIAEMELFLDKKNWQEVSKQAHKMKSPIALMGAIQLKELFAKIEMEAIVNNDKEILTRQIRTAQKQCLGTVDELKDELQKIKV